MGGFLISLRVGGNCPPDPTAAHQRRRHADDRALAGYRVYFYSHEPNEPPHIHVDARGCTAKFWLQPVALARNIDLGALAQRLEARPRRPHAQDAGDPRRHAQDEAGLDGPA
jgi:Domain of unknown function (DUF4160)